MTLPVLLSSPCSFCEGTKIVAADWYNKFVEWLKKPYHEEMSVVGWFAFSGLLLVIGFMWATIIRKIEVNT
jgi:hypothetical protein